jgi:hypothetical protein
MTEFKCDNCNLVYKHKASLTRHIKKCITPIQTEKTNQNIKEITNLNNNLSQIIEMDNSKIINNINQLFHNKGIKHEKRLNILLELLEYKNNNINNINNNEYKDIIQLLTTINYKDDDFCQELFMLFSSKYTKINLDQFYTPQTISKFINLLMIKNKNAIDPAGGTGDLLLYYEGERNIWDIDENVIKLCKLNYELHSDNYSNKYILKCKNSLEDFENDISKYSYVVMNPPFGSSTIITDKHILDKFVLGKNKKKQEIGILFLELGLKLLKNNGILFIIVPSGYVGNKNSYDLRDFILNGETEDIEDSNKSKKKYKNRLIASISLPDNTFKRSGTGVNTYLLIIQKNCISSNTDVDKKISVSNYNDNYNIFISNVNNIGYILSKKDTPKKYKIIKETGIIMKDSNNNDILDNDLDNIYNSFSKYVIDNNIKGFNISKSNLDNISYEQVKYIQLKDKIIDIKRYLKQYTDIVNKLNSQNAVKLNTLGNIITTINKIQDTKKYKYIDISEINSPLYTYKELYGWELPSRAKYTVKKYDILISKLEGNLSYCVILNDDDSYIVTNGVSIIRPKNMTSLYIIFSNILKNDFQVQRNSFLTGSIMASLNDSDIEEILIDTKNIDIEISKKILETLETLQLLKS